MHSSSLSLLCAVLLGAKYLGFQSVGNGGEFFCWAYLIAETFLATPAINIRQKRDKQ